MLTPGQSAIYSFIATFIKANGYSPTTREIEAGIGRNSSSHCTATIEQLAAKNLITFTPKKARSIKLIGERK